MTQANELRIGNLVRIKEHDAIVKVEPYMLSFSELINYSPIPLTPEILENCGFVKIENGWLFLDLGFASFSWERLAGFAMTIDDKSIYIPHVKYLHQLQNLYFALTGEELEINL